MAGTVAASGTIDVQWLILLLIFAASLGDNTNYWIGRYFGPKMFNRSDSNILNFTHLRKPRNFMKDMAGKPLFLHDSFQLSAPLPLSLLVLDVWFMFVSSHAAC